MTELSCFKTRIRKDGKPWAKRKKSKPGYIPQKIRSRLRHDPEFKAKHEAEMKAHTSGRCRAGIPDGMRREHAMALWVQAKDLGKKFIKIMEDADKVEKTVVPGSEAEMAKKALEEAFVMAVSPLTSSKEKAGFLRIVLDFTKAKPESKSKLTIDKSEEWLAALEQDMKKDDGQAGDTSPTA